MMYDEAVRNSIDTSNHLIPNTVYFDSSYRNALIDILKQKNIYDRFKSELNRNYGKGRYKMCSVASSARLAFLKYGNENAEFEKTDITNKGCKPHYDVYFPDKNLFIECKCHELLKSYEIILEREPYENLLREYLGIENLRVSPDGKKIYVDLKVDFGIDLNGNDLHFDFKQLLCHTFGLLTREKTSLKYVIFVPDEKFWNKMTPKTQIAFDLMKRQIRQILAEFAEIKLTSGQMLKERISFSYEIVNVSSISDYILDEIRG